jgi:hypothetical protein
MLQEPSREVNAPRLTTQHSIQHSPQNSTQPAAPIPRLPGPQHSPRSAFETIEKQNRTGKLGVPHSSLHTQALKKRCVLDAARGLRQAVRKLLL